MGGSHFFLPALTKQFCPATFPRISQIRLSDPHKGTSFLVGAAAWLQRIHATSRNGERLPRATKEGRVGRGIVLSRAHYAPTGSPAQLASILAGLFRSRVYGSSMPERNSNHPDWQALCDEGCFSCGERSPHSFRRGCTGEPRGNPFFPSPAAAAVGPLSSWRALSRRERRFLQSSQASNQPGRRTRAGRSNFQYRNSCCLRVTHTSVSCLRPGAQLGQKQRNTRWWATAALGRVVVSLRLWASCFSGRLPNVVTAHHASTP